MKRIPENSFKSFSFIVIPIIIAIVREINVERKFDIPISETVKMLKELLFRKLPS